MQIPNGTEPGVRRNKRPLLASCSRYKCRMETSRNKVMTSKTVIRSSSVTMSELGGMSDQSIKYTACWCKSVLLVVVN